MVFLTVGQVRQIAVLLTMGLVRQTDSCVPYRGPGETDRQQHFVLWVW